MTGRHRTPPRWALGFHQSKWNYAPADNVREIAQEFRDRKLPADVIWIDIDYMDAYKVFTFDPEFGAPVKLNSDLHERGWRSAWMIDSGSIGLLGLALAGGFLDNRILPLGTLGALFSAGAIPLISALIGLKVGAEFSSILASLAETRQAQAGRVEPVGDTPAAWVQPDRDNPGAAHTPTGPATTADREQP